MWPRNAVTHYTLYLKSFFLNYINWLKCSARGYHQSTKTYVRQLMQGLKYMTANVLIQYIIFRVS